VVGGDECVGLRSGRWRLLTIDSAYDDEIAQSGSVFYAESSEEATINAMVEGIVVGYL